MHRSKWDPKFITLYLQGPFISFCSDFPCFALVLPWIPLSNELHIIVESFNVKVRIFLSVAGAGGHRFGVPKNIIAFQGVVSLGSCANLSRTPFPTDNLNIWFHHALGQQWSLEILLAGPLRYFPAVHCWLVLHRPDLPIRYPVPAVSSKQLTVAWKRHSRLQRLPPWIHCNAQIYCLEKPTRTRKLSKRFEQQWSVSSFIIWFMTINATHWKKITFRLQPFQLQMLIMNHHESWCCSFLQQPSQTWSWETALVQGVVGQMAHAVVHVCLVRRFLSDCRNFSSYCLSNQAP